MPISSAQGLAPPELIKSLLSDGWEEHQDSRQKAVVTGQLGVQGLR